MSTASGRPRRPRVCLDLNVLVAAEIARAKGHGGTVPLLLVGAARRGDFGLVISRAMLDRLVDVLMRPPLRSTFALASERADEYAQVSMFSNLLVVGGGVAPVRDEEDRGVLEAALAARADYLATYNLADFEPAAERDPQSGMLLVRTLRILHPRDLVVELGLVRR